MYTYYDLYDELFIVGGPQGRYLIEEVDGEVEITNQLDRVVENEGKRMYGIEKKFSKKMKDFEKDIKKKLK